MRLRTGFSTEVSRAALSVPGTPFSLIMTRSQDFALYYSIMQLNLYSARDARLLMTLYQTAWDTIEAGATDSHLSLHDTFALGCCSSVTNSHCNVAAEQVCGLLRR